MSNMRLLIESFDRTAKENIKDYYIVSRSRLDNLIFCFEDGAKRIKELTEIINDQQKTIEMLSKELTNTKETEE